MKCFVLTNFLIKRMVRFMKFPTTELCVSLPEQLGIIEHVNAVIKIIGKDLFSIPCKHVLRYHSVNGSEWPEELFDINSNLINLNFEFDNTEQPNTSYFVGNYVFYDETYLKGELYFCFDYCKDDIWYTNIRTNLLPFNQDKEDYFDLKKMLNGK